jgi:hypothetical protein
MRFTIPALALACAIGGAQSLAAQVTEPSDPPDAAETQIFSSDMSDAPPPQVRGFAPMMHRTPGVSFLLARTGQLELTDAQVTKLAAIARREADRHKAMRANMDSSMTHWTPGARHDTTGMRQRMQAMRDAFKKEHDAQHADLRDALTVLNPDQQAHAWEMIAAQHHRGRHGRGGNMMFMRRGGPGGGGRIQHGPGPDGGGPMPQPRPPS